MRISLSFSFFLWLFIFMATASVAADKFKQDVPPGFEKKIIEAKEYRLPYNEKYDPEKSVKILKDLLKVKPDYYRAHYNLGLAYSELNDYQNAKESFEKAFEMREKESIPDVTIFNAAGWASMKAGDYKRAEELFMKGIELKKDNTFRSNRALYNNLGLLYFNTQRFNEAKRYLEVARDEYGSRSAANTLQIIKELEEAEKEKRGANNSMQPTRKMLTADG